MPLTKKPHIGLFLVLCFLLALAYRTYTGDAALTAYGISIVLGTTVSFAIGLFALLWVIKRLS